MLTALYLELIWSFTFLYALTADGHLLQVTHWPGASYKPTSEDLNYPFKHKLLQVEEKLRWEREAVGRRWVSADGWRSTESHRETKIRTNAERKEKSLCARRQEQQPARGRSCNSPTEELFGSSLRPETVFTSEHNEETLNRRCKHAASLHLLCFPLTHSFLDIFLHY